MKIEPLTLTYSQVDRPLVSKNGARFIPLFKAADIDRDTFFHLRTQLIKLGCPKEDVLLVAKKLCMEILKINSEEKYLKHILEDTYLKCKSNINSGYDPCPIQDIHNSDYSHTNLFSSIYGFEIEYLKSKGVYSEIADIGCGEGIFAKLAKGYDIDAEGYEIQRPTFSHDVKINLIEDFYDTKKPYKCLIYNHVLEHAKMRPDFYLSLVINHFEENIVNNRLKLIIVSLPMHIHLASHLACKHQWVCTDDYIEKNLEKLIIRNDINIFYPTIAFSAVAKRFKFKLIVKKQMGIYVFEK